MVVFFIAVILIYQEANVKRQENNAARAIQATNQQTQIKLEWYGCAEHEQYDSFIVHSDADEMEREGVPWKYYKIKKYCQLMLSSYVLYTRISIKKISIFSSFSSYPPSPVSLVSHLPLYAGIHLLLIFLWRGWVCRAATFKYYD